MPSAPFLAFCLTQALAISGVLIGTSLNQPINSPLYSFNNTLDLEHSCYNAMIQDPGVSYRKLGKYFKCDANYAYYNNF